MELAGIGGDAKDGAERIVTLANAVRRLLAEEAAEQIKERRAG